MPNQFSQQTERRIVAFALAHPGAGPDRIASELRREKWGELVVSASRVYRVLRRHGRLEARAIGQLERQSPAGAEQLGREWVRRHANERAVRAA